MDPATRELAAIRCTEDAGRSVASLGREWEALIELGLDVTLLQTNLALSPMERLRRADVHRRFSTEVQRRTVSEAVLAAQEADRLWSKIDALGGPDPAWPSELRDGR